MKISRRQKGIIGIIFICLLILLSWFGLSERYPESNSLRYLPDRIYRITKIVLGTDPSTDPLEPQLIPWELILAKLFVIIILFVGVFKIIERIFNEQITLFRIALKKEHVIVIGTTEKSKRILNNLKKNYAKTGVAIEKRIDEGNISQLRREGHLTVVGNATDPGTLREAGIERAKVVISFIDDEQSSIQIAETIHKIYDKKHMNHELHAYICLKNGRLMELVQRSGLYQNRRENGLFVHLFNEHKMVARNFFNRLVLDLQPLINDSNVKFKLVLLGLGHFGQALLLQACRVFHIQSEQSIEVVVYDTHAATEARVFLEKYPEITQIFSIQFRTFNGTWSDILTDCSLDQKETHPLLIVGFDDDKVNLDLSLEIRQATLQHTFTIYVLNTRGMGLQSLFSSSDDHRLLFFGSADTYCHAELITGEKQDKLAKAIHEDYLTQLSGVSSESSAYTTSWDELKEEAKDANRAQADHILLKLLLSGKYDSFLQNGQLSFSTNEVEQLAMVEHRRWMAHRYINGWRYASERDDNSKTHPSLVPWEQLSAGEQQKDRETVKRIPMILKDKADLNC